VKHYQLWHRIQTIRRKTDKGAFCINSEKKNSAEQRGLLRAQCDDWVARGMPTAQKQEWLMNYKESVGRRFNLFNGSSVCGDVEESVDAECEFDGKELALFTEEVKKNGGDFSISFWYKPFDEQSLIGDRFLPHLAFYSTLFPPKHNLVLGVFDSNPNGELRVHSNCRRADSSQMFETLHTGAAAVDGWTRFTYVRKNATRHTTRSDTLMQNIKQQFQETKTPLCLFDEENMFSAIEINYPMYITPIELYPEALHVEDLQIMYYNVVEDMVARSGPVLPYREMINVEQLDYVKRSALVAPPIIFQVRNAEAACDFAYADSWVDTQKTFAKEQVCGNANVRCNTLHSPVSCSEKKDSAVGQNETYFGLKPLKFGGADGFADLLYTMTDNSHLLRDGYLQLTKNFIDSHTSVLKVAMTLFAPEAGVLSLVTIYADVRKTKGMDVSYSIDFFNMLDGPLLCEYLFYEGMSLVLSAVLMVQAALHIYQFWNRGKIPVLENSGLPDETEYFSVLLDISFVMIPVAVVLRILTKLHSSADIEHMIERWSHIEWDNDNVGILEKKVVFFEGVAQIKRDIEDSKSRDMIVFLTLIICMLRMLQQTSLHPRLALITGTMSFAAGHLMHALVVALAVMCSFAAVAEWRFGIFRKEFGDFNTALASQVTMFFNPDPFEGWVEQFEMIIFTMLLMFMMTLLVLNFILAIIVESYMQVRKEIEKNLIEQSFPEDLYSAALVLTNQMWWRWPPPAVLGAKLNHFKVKHSVGYFELEQTKLFPNHAALVSFIGFYKQYTFCKCEVISKYGKKAKTIEESIAQEVEKRIARLFGMEMRGLKDLAKSQGANAKRKQANHFQGHGAMSKDSSFNPSGPAMYSRLPAAQFASTVSSRNLNVLPSLGLQAEPHVHQRVIEAESERQRESGSGEGGEREVGGRAAGGARRMTLPGNTRVCVGQRYRECVCECMCVLERVVIRECV